MRSGQSSLEYLLTYALALFVLAGAMAALAANRPDISPPDQCSVSGPFRCLEYTKQGSTLQLLLEPSTQRDLTVSNATISYRDTTSTDYCDLTPSGAGLAVSNISIDRDTQFEVTCDIASLSGTAANEFLAEQESIEVDYVYQENGLSFNKQAQTTILI